MECFQFCMPAKVLCGQGMATDFSNDCKALGVKRLFVLTDKTLNQMGVCEPIFDHLRDGGVEVVGVFDDVAPDSSLATVQSGVVAAQKAGAEGFLAIGGGSVMDTAKAVNTVFTLGGSLKEDYCGAQTIEEKLSPLIAIPTTAGTGSEVTGAMVIYDEEEQLKLSFIDDHLIPDLAVLDATLTTKLPPLITAATAMDAITHAIEALWSLQKNPISEALSYQAITLIDQNLSLVLEDGDNLKAREALLIAANLAGMAIQHSMVGVVHAVAHSMGAVSKVPHGVANALFLPYGMEYNAGVAKDVLTDLSKHVGSKNPGPSGAIDWAKSLLAQLSKQTGFPKTLTEAGITKDQLRTIADLSESDGASFYNPREVVSEDIYSLCLQAL